MSTATNTNQHYDLDPDIFGAFLDPLRKYSSGLYADPTGTDPADTLENAQIRKLRYVADRLGLEAGSRILDVGCGWGSLILFMAAELDCTAVGISPAPRQHDYIASEARRRGVSARVRTVVGHFEDTPLNEGPFDAISMLGSIVHMPDADAVCRKARTLLRRGGRLYISESCFRNDAMRSRFGERDGSQFVRDAIFGWGDMRPLSTLIRSVEDAGFSVIAVDDLTAHYRRTIDDWITNVDAHADEIDATSPGMAASLRRYLQVANAGWGYTTKHYSLTCVNAR